MSVGHCHDRVMEAVNKQNNLLQHTTTIYLNDQVALFAKELADRMPGNLKVPPPPPFPLLHTSAPECKCDIAILAPGQGVCECRMRSASDSSCRRYRCSSRILHLQFTALC